MAKTYRKYMKGEFDLTKIEKIENVVGRNKPTGGCWASPVDAAYSWEYWASSEIPEWLEGGTIVDFQLKESAKVFELHNIDDYRRMPLLKKEGYFNDTIVPDFEAIEAMGYDAVELFLSDEESWLSSEEDTLYTALCGWDCDSIIIFNGDAIDEKSITLATMPEEIKERIARVKASYAEYEKYCEEEEDEDLAYDL